MIETVESLGTPEKMSLLQQAFQEKHGAQCGFCTPGILMTMTAFLKENPNPTLKKSVKELMETFAGALDIRIS